MQSIIGRSVLFGRNEAEARSELNSSFKELLIEIARRYLRPHHGAKNSTSDGLPDFRTTSSKLLGIRSITAETASAPRIAKEAMKTFRSKTMLKVNGVCSDKGQMAVTMCGQN